MKLRLHAVWLLVGLLAVLAIGTRLVDLDRRPFDPAEAEAALAAAEAAGAGSPFFEPAGVGPGPAYALPTGLLFQWFGSSVSGARLISGLAGAGLVLLPLLLAGRLGWPLALAWSALLAGSTAALQASRAAGSASLAAGAILLALVALSRTDTDRWRRWAGLGLGLGLAAGPAFWMGLFGLALGGVFAGLEARRVGRPGSMAGEVGAGMRDRRVWFTALATVGALILLAGVNREGVAAMIAAPGAWLEGWVLRGGLPLLPSLLLLPAYEPFLLLGGGAGWVVTRHAEDRLHRAAGWWALGALVAFLLYPARQPIDLVWVSIPLALLASRLVLHWIHGLIDSPSPLTVLLLAGFLMTVATFAYFQLEAATAGFGLATLDRQIQLGYALAAIGFSVVLVFLFGLGWSWRETTLAVGLAAMVCLLGLNFSASARLELEPGNVELWRPRHATPNLGLLEETVVSFANAYQGAAVGLPVEVRGVVPAEIAWVLRHQRPASASAEAERPPVVLAAESGAPPALPADYLGQGFATLEGWAFAGQLPDDLVGWWLDRRGTSLTSSWILYVRMDVATLGEAPAVGAPPAGAE
jgi:hypothetical protein